MKIRSAFFSLISFAASLFSYPTDWSPGAEIPTGSTGEQYSYVVALVYDAFTQQMVATWADSPNQNAVFSLFNGTSWTAAQTIPMGSSPTVYDNVMLAYNSSTQEVFAAWTDDVMFLPWFSIYDGSSWSPAAQIPLGMSMNLQSNVYLAYDSASSQVVATWADQNSNPFAAYHDGTGWILTEMIPLGLSNGVSTDVTVCYNSIDNQIFVAWVNFLNDLPYYSRRVSGVWMTDPMNQGPTNGVYNYVELAYDSIGNRVFGSWVDLTNQRVYYSIFSAGAWSAGAIIDHGPSSGSQSDAYLGFDPDSNAMYIGWSDKVTNLPYYSVYSGGAWATGAQFPLGASNGAFDVFLAYNSGQFAMFATWSNQSPFIPIWTSTSLTPFPSSSIPPNFRRPSTRRPRYSIPI